jgi:uncharacterized protein YggT (Ycf19 family)
MGYYETNPIGLIIAALNVATFLLLVYFILEWVADERSRVFRVLDSIWTPLLGPIRRLLPARKLDASALILAAVLQMIVLAMKRFFGL